MRWSRYVAIHGALQIIKGVIAMGKPKKTDQELREECRTMLEGMMTAMYAQIDALKGGDLRMLHDQLTIQARAAAGQYSEESGDAGNGT